VYAVAILAVEHAIILTIPASAVMTEGGLTYCCRIESCKARRTPATVGLRDKDFGGREATA
jgi:hypothetical protein